jgi:hypothetical protein
MAAESDYKTSAYGCVYFLRNLCHSSGERRSSLTECLSLSLSFSVFIACIVCYLSGV